jgi:ubiquinone/menaquinone biosynthesis C-methylase UbiE
VEHKLPLNAQVLDIACGTGALALPALAGAQRERMATGTGQGGGLVTATDFSAGMVEQTRREAVTSGTDADLLRAEVQNGEALTYADASFDAVFSCFGIFLFQDRMAGWREALRVLKPGGTFATTVWKHPEHNALAREQGLPVVRALPARLQPKVPGGGWMEISNAEALLAEVTKVAPLTDLRCRSFQMTFVFQDGRRLWDTIRTNPVMGALIAKCTPEELEACRQRALGHWRELAGGDTEPLVLDSACNILTATRA